MGGCLSLIRGTKTGKLNPGGVKSCGTKSGGTKSSSMKSGGMISGGMKPSGMKSGGKRFSGSHSRGSRLGGSRPIRSMGGKMPRLGGPVLGESDIRRPRSIRSVGGKMPELKVPNLKGSKSEGSRSVRWVGENFRDSRRSSLGGSDLGRSQPIRFMGDKMPKSPVPNGIRSPGPRGGKSPRSEGGPLVKRNGVAKEKIELIHDPYLNEPWKLEPNGKRSQLVQRNKKGDEVWVNGRQVKSPGLSDGGRVWFSQSMQTWGTPSSVINPYGGQMSPPQGGYIVSGQWGTY